MKLRFIIFLFFLLSSFFSFSQKKGYDSTYYTKYRDRLIISYYQSYKSYEIDIAQKITKDSLGTSKVNYMAEASLISGFEINYDKFNISFGYKSTPPKDFQKKGNTKYKNFVLNVGGNHWVIENSYRSYKGFYNKNTISYDTTIKQTGIYDKLPTLHSEAYKTKFLFFTNANKFSFKSGYSCSYRQLRSAFSFVLSANIYYNRLNSDSSFIPYPVRNFYDTHQNVNGLNAFAFSVYGGGSFNLVLWKAFFMNVTLIIGPEQQWRTYRYISGYPTQDIFYSSISGDFRGSMGLNFKKFFCLVSATSDFSWYNGNGMEYLSKYGSLNFSIGYRFRMKPGKGYRRFQESKFYRKL